MKNPLYNVILLGLSVATASTLDARAQNQVNLPIADGTKIVVYYTESVVPLYLGGANPAGAETDRFYSFAQVVKEAFADADLPVEVEVVKLGSKKTGDLDITINVNTWELNSIGEYECRFFASISNGQERMDLGVFVGKMNEMSISSGSNTKHTYDVAARRAVDQMVKRFTRA
jgi:hypothetical protein